MFLSLSPLPLTHKAIQDSAHLTLFPNMQPMCINISHAMAAYVALLSSVADGLARWPHATLFISPLPRMSMLPVFINDVYD